MTFKFTHQNRDELTRQLAKAMDLNYHDLDHQSDIESFLWFNPKTITGYRLSESGVRCLIDELKLDYYKFAFAKDQVLTPKLLLDLDRNLTSPYYLAKLGLRVVAVVLFGPREAMLAQLYDDVFVFAAALPPRSE